MACREIRAAPFPQISREGIVRARSKLRRRRQIREVMRKWINLEISRSQAAGLLFRAGYALHSAWDAIRKTER
jgi:hypothetical protein